MSISSQVQLGSGSDQIQLTFDGTATSFENIDYQHYYKKVIHRVQQEHAFLRRWVRYEDQKTNFDWVTRTNKRNPTRRTNSRPNSPDAKQTYDTRGVAVEAYDDGSLLSQAIIDKQTTTISVPKSTFEAMEMGYERLFDDIALSGMLKPVRQQTSSSWATAEKGSTSVALDVAKYAGARISNGQLANPNLKTFLAIKAYFTRNNVMMSKGADMMCGLSTGGFEEFIGDLDEYKNQDYIYHAMEKASSEGFYIWKGIRWVSVLGDADVGAEYASVYVGRTSTTQNSDLNFLNTNATVDTVAQFDLTDSNHEVIPIWKPSNIVVRTRSSAYINKIVNRPDKMDFPHLLMSKSLGATRVQDECGFNLVIPA